MVMKFESYRFVEVSVLVCTCMHAKINGLRQVRVHRRSLVESPKKSK